MQSFKQWFSERAHAIGAAYTAQGKGLPVPARVTERHTKILLGLLRQMMPFHIYGRDPSAQGPVASELKKIVAAYLETKPTPTAEDLKRHEMTHLTEARMACYERLSPSKQMYWKDRAREDVGVADDEDM